MKKLTTKVFITGGHLAPALAVIEEIVDRKLQWDVVFVGRPHDFEGNTASSREKDIITSRGIRFVGLTTGRLQRSFSLYTVISLCKIPIGFIQSLILCFKEKPDAIISFGGYVALPVVVAAALRGVPVLTHEQTRLSGLANRLIGFFARKICISFSDTDRSFPRNKTVLTGLPVRKGIFTDKRENPFKVNVKTYSLIYITGGTTGSVSLNNLLFPIIERLVRSHTVIHQTGKISIHKALELRREMSPEQQQRYIVKEYFDEGTVGWILRSAGLVVSRSGANTVTELAILGKKAILIPLPWSGEEEQLRNAEWLEKRCLVYIVDQKKATSDVLLDSVDRIVREKKEFLDSRDIPLNGAALVVNEVEKILLTQ